MAERALQTAPTPASTPFAISASDSALAAQAATIGDLKQLTPDQRTALYGAICSSMGLNPLSQPFQYITLNGKLTLYATKTATDQLRKLNGVSIIGTEKEVIDGILMVTVHARDQHGREDTEIGAVSIGGLKGDALANAHMKALTKAKRRVTLSISGLGWLDETEVGTIPSAQATIVDHETGEILRTDPAPTPIRQVAAPATEDNGDALRALVRWGGELGLTLDDLNLTAAALSKGEITDLRTAPAGRIRTVASKLSDAHQRDADKFFAWINGLAYPSETSPSEPTPTDAPSLPLDVEVVTNAEEWTR